MLPPAVALNYPRKALFWEQGLNILQGASDLVSAQYVLHCDSYTRNGFLFAGAQLVPYALSHASCIWEWMAAMTDDVIGGTE